ncbi:MAG: xanthine dehydrogenase family protein subunit M [Nitrososphaerota archaeon]|nr:xanthine dehydrogenase family protein subunit M [Nitrososphaerota archaeon]MDG6924323.1 xanthine dehydrogenase family protein subunit M [Nitrososphaerota archaeon]
MYPKSFEYFRAKDVQDALFLLKSHQDAKIIAGGQSLVPMMKLRVANPPKLIDISRLKELRYIKEDNSSSTPMIHIGALTTHADVIESDVINKRLPILSSTASNIGDVQIRERGTVGGSICHADPSADYFPTLLVLNASLVARTFGGNRRSVPIGEFVVGPFETSLHENELIEELAVPIYSGMGDVVKFARRKADFALVSAAAILDYDPSKGNIRDFRLAIAPQENSAVRLFKVEERIKNKRFSDFSELEKSIHSGLSEETLTFPGDLHGSSWYRSEILETIVVRLVRKLYEGKQEMH